MNTRRGGLVASSLLIWLVPALAVSRPALAVARSALAVLLCALAAHSALAGDKAPAFVLENATGDMVSLSDFRGQPLVLHFWATWCPYCKKLQPGLQALQEDYLDSTLVVVAVSFREDEGADPQAALVRRGLSFSTLLSGDDVARMYYVRGTPTTFFIDRGGVIRGKTHTSDPEDPVLREMADLISR